MRADNPFRTLKNTPPRVNETSFLDETKKTWAGIYPTLISDEDALDISKNMSAFLALLIQWDLTAQSSTTEIKKTARVHTTRTSPNGKGPANV